MHKGIQKGSESKVTCTCPKDRHMDCGCKIKSMVLNGKVYKYTNECTKHHVASMDARGLF